MITRREFLGLGITTAVVSAAPWDLLSRPSDRIDLAELRQKCLEGFIAALDTPAPRLDSPAQKALRYLGGHPDLACHPALAAPLRRLSRASEEAPLRTRANALLSLRGDAAARRELLRYPREPGDKDSMIALACLVQSGNQAGAPNLIRGLYAAPNVPVSRTIIEALLSAGDSAALLYLDKNLSGPDRVIALRNFPGDRGCHLLAATLQQIGSLQGRMYLAMDVWRGGYRDLRRLLGRAVQEPSATRAALDSVLFLGERQYLPYLRRIALLDESAIRREQGDFILTMMGDPGGLERMKARWRLWLDRSTLFPCASRLDAAFLRELCQARDWDTRTTGLMLAAERGEGYATVALATMVQDANPIQVMSLIDDLSTYTRPSKRYLALCEALLHLEPTRSDIETMLEAVHFTWDTLEGRCRRYPPDLHLYPYPGLGTASRTVWSIRHPGRDF